MKLCETHFYHSQNNNSSSECNPKVGVIVKTRCRAGWDHVWSKEEKNEPVRCIKCGQYRGNFIW